MHATPVNRIFSTFIVAVVLFGIILLLFFFGSFDTLQSQLTDRFYTESEPSTEIIIVDVDEESLQVIGQWPWDRKVHAELLGIVGHAKVVGFDVIFSEASRLGSESDIAFSNAIENSVATVVLPTLIDEQSGVVARPHALLDEVTESGFVNIFADRDGVVRFMDVVRGEESSFDAVILDNKSFPEQIRIDYRGPAKTYTTISYVDVIEEKIPASVFGDKIVLVGAGAAGLGDNFQTSFGTMSGTEIHANSIDTLQNGEFYGELSVAGSIAFFVLITLTGLVIVRYVRQILYLLASTTLGVIVIFGFSFVAFEMYIVMPHLYAVLLFFLVVGGVLIVEYAYEFKEKQYIRRGFEKYVDAEVVEELCSHPDMLRLGGETRELTILFSDIRGFTTISENLTPQELMSQLNEYLTRMSDVVMDRKGLVDKYIGDAVMAFWGAPLSDDIKEINACESVLGMKRELDALNEKWKSEGRGEFRIGVGISTGEVVVGNMGSERHFNYSIIGDEVNFTARLEGLTKQYGAMCIIGEYTRQKISDQKHLLTRELDDVMVKGKKEPRKIFELIVTEPTPLLLKVLEHFKEGREYYKVGDFKNAVTSFRAALDVDKEDEPSRVFLKRALALEKNPPTDWNGVYEFTTK